MVAVAHAHMERQAGSPPFEFHFLIGVIELALKDPFLFQALFPLAESRRARPRSVAAPGSSRVRPDSVREHLVKLEKLRVLL